MAHSFAAFNSEPRYRPAAEARTVPRHLGGDVDAVKCAAQRATFDRLDHRLRGNVAARLVSFRRGQAVEPDRHGADHDRVAIAHVGDFSGEVQRGHGAAVAAVTNRSSASSGCMAISVADSRSSPARRPAAYLTPSHCI